MAYDASSCAAQRAAALYPLSCNGESLRRSLLAVTLTRPRLVRTPGSGSVAVSDRAHTAPGSLPEIAAPTLPDHRFSIYGWMLSMMIAREGELRKRRRSLIAGGKSGGRSGGVLRDGKMAAVAQ